MAAGYNSFHEALALRLPTVFVPNLETSMDDQAARARFAQHANVGLQWDGDDAAGLTASVDRVLSKPSRAEIVESMGQLPAADGAIAAAAAIGRWASPTPEAAA